MRCCCVALYLRLLYYTCTQDEKALYDAATRGDVYTVRRLIASHVNVDCTPYGVGGTQNCVREYSLIVHVVMGCKGHRCSH